MEAEYQAATSLSSLQKATRQCANNVRWKDSVIAYEDKSLLKNKALSREIQSGKYKISPYIRFYVYEPKKRLIHATRIRDRVWQRSMCNSGLYSQITKSLISDNAACRKTYGTDYAIERLKKHLRKYHSAFHTNSGWAAHLDIHHYFPSTPHITALNALEEHIADPNFLRHACDIVNSFTEGERKDCGIYLGSQMSQLIELAVLDDIDHYLKEHMHVKFYIRYMDDIIMLDNDLEHLKKCVDYIRRALYDLGLELNDKTCIYPIEQGVIFLHKKFMLTDTGKIIVRIDDKSISKERRKSRKLKALLDTGRIDFSDVERQYQSWRSNAKKYSNSVVFNMDKYYRKVFGTKPAEKVRGKDVKKVSINELAKMLMDDVDVSISESASAADALCDIDAASDERMSSIEDAICDLDKIINGGETA